MAEVKICCIYSTFIVSDRLLCYWLTLTSTGARICCFLQQHMNRQTCLNMNFYIPASIHKHIYSREPLNWKYWSIQLLTNPVSDCYFCLYSATRCLQVSQTGSLRSSQCSLWSTNHATMHVMEIIGAALICHK